MSNEKLSELSKPAAFIVRSPLGDVAYRTISQADADYIAARKGYISEPLYSQEYVSALQHESAVNWEAATSLVAENEELKRALEAKDKRIAEVEDSHKKLRETLAAVHNTITGGGAYTSLAGILTAVKRAYLESSDASASTVTVEGDE